MSKSSGPGRPKKDPEHARTEAILVRVSPTEKADIEALAEGYGMPTSTFMRALATGDAPSAPHSQAMDRAWTQLGRVGFDMNLACEQLETLCHYLREHGVAPDGAQADDEVLATEVREMLTLAQRTERQVAEVKAVMMAIREALHDPTVRP